MLAAFTLAVSSCTKEDKTGSTVSVTGMTLDKPALELSAGDAETLIATVAPENATNKAVKWNSDNKTVATVDQTGLVTAVAPGGAVITATTEDGGKTASCHVAVTAAPWDGTSRTEPADRDDDAKTISVASPAELAWLASACNGTDGVEAGNFEDYTITLTSDIDLNNHEWTPIGSGIKFGDPYADPYYFYTFGAIFDGNGHTVSNLKIDSEDEYIGLFGYVTGQIENLGIASGSIQASGDALYVGGICGHLTNSNSCTITACYNRADITCLSDEPYAGGICGNNQASIVACYNTGNLTGGWVAGGICGHFYGDAITACYSTGIISGGSYATGGLCAYNQGGSGPITACYWTKSTQGAVNGIGSGNTGDVQEFSGSAWSAIGTATGQSAEWGTGDGSGSGKYWKSIGSWNNGTPTYPKLWWEK